MKRYKIIFFCFLLFICDQANAQTMQIDNVQACVGNIASIPVSLSAINNVGAITLFIGYDTAMIDSIYLTNINPLASGTMYNDIRVPINGPRIGKIGISWIDNAGTGVDFNAGFFALLNFRVVSGVSCPVDFIPNCEIADSAGDPINVTYIDGSLTVSADPVITTQPLPLSLCTTQTGYLVVTATDYDSFQWQINQGGDWVNIDDGMVFQGTANDTLFISQPDQTLDGFYFRCMVSNACLSVPSDSAVLNVTVMSGDGVESICSIIYPNPFTDYILFDFSNSTFTEEINIFQTDGKLVKQITKKEDLSQLIVTQLNGLKKGTYIFEIIFKNKGTLHVKNTYRLVKN